MLTEKDYDGMAPVVVGICFGCRRQSIPYWTVSAGRCWTGCETCRQLWEVVELPGWDGGWFRY